MVQQINSTGEVLNSGHSTAVLTVSTLTDLYHGSKYTCRMQSELDLEYTIIILGELLFSV